MIKRSPVGIFIAATAILSSSVLHADVSHAEDNELGGLKEWNTDQAIEEESTLDEDAKKAKKKAEKEDICIPIGEGENCW